MADTSRHDAWQAGDSYDAYMGRWSRQVAPRFLDWLDAGDGLDWLEVGCGTGALSAAIVAQLQSAEPGRHRPVRGLCRPGPGPTLPDKRVSFRVGDAQALDLPDRQPRRGRLRARAELRARQDAGAQGDEARRARGQPHRLLRVGLSRRRHRVHARLLERRHRRSIPRQSNSRKAGASPSARRTGWRRSQRMADCRTSRSLPSKCRRCLPTSTTTGGPSRWAPARRRAIA